MNAAICGETLEGRQQQSQPSHLAQYSSECRKERERCSKPTRVWRAEYDAYLKAHDFGGLNRRFQVLNRMVRLTGLPRWYIKRQVARLGLTLHMDRRAWTHAEVVVRRSWLAKRQSLQHCETLPTPSVGRFR
jgi:hypothetical protein